MKNNRILLLKRKEDLIQLYDKFSPISVEFGLNNFGSPIFLKMEELLNEIRIEKAHIDKKLENNS